MAAAYDALEQVNSWLYLWVMLVQIQTLVKELRVLHAILIRLTLQLVMPSKTITRLISGGVCYLSLWSQW